VEGRGDTTEAYAKRDQLFFGKEELGELGELPAVATGAYTTVPTGAAARSARVAICHSLLVSELEV
jgi:hypothetical protein